MKDIPLFEYDDEQQAIINPKNVIAELDIPQHCVLCFFQDVLSTIMQEHNGICIWSTRSEIGTHQTYHLVVNNQGLIISHAGLGAPLSAIILEQLIALGCHKFIVCGGAGVLDPNIHVGDIIIPTAAVRDEGTSYHYLPSHRESSPDPHALAAIERTLNSHQLPYLTAKTWTTDALYRETRTKSRRRRVEGCLAVEMEAAALFAVAQFRRVQLAQILYAGDVVSETGWLHRDWDNVTTIRQKIFWLAVEACLLL